MPLQRDHHRRLRQHGILGARVHFEDLGSDAAVRLRRQPQSGASAFAQIQSAVIEACMARECVEDERTLRGDRSLLQQLQIGEKVSEAADRHGQGQDNAGLGNQGFLVAGCSLLVEKRWS
jgi:hypothetical protein